MMAFRTFAFDHLMLQITGLELSAAYVYQIRLFATLDYLKINYKVLTAQAQTKGITTFNSQRRKVFSWFCFAGTSVLIGFLHFKII